MNAIRYVTEPAVALARRLLRWLGVVVVEHVDDIPDHPQTRTLYAVGERGRLWSAALVCPCGCGQLLQLNLVRTSRPCWRLQEDRFGRASLHPSVWRKTTCRSHFWLRSGRIVWAGSREASVD